MYPCKVNVTAKFRQIAVLFTLIVCTPLLFAFPVLVSSSSLGQKLISPELARAIFDSSFYLALTVLLVVIIFILMPFTLYRLIIAYASHYLRLDILTAHTNEFPDCLYFIRADGSQVPSPSEYPAPDHNNAYRLQLGLTYPEVGHCLFHMRYISHRLSYTIPLRASLLPEPLQNFQPKVSLRLVGSLITNLEEGDMVYLVYHYQFPASLDVYSPKITEFTIPANILNL